MFSGAGAAERQKGRKNNPPSFCHSPKRDRRNIAEQLSGALGLFFPLPRFSCQLPPPRSPIPGPGLPPARFPLPNQCGGAGAPAP